MIAQLTIMKMHNYNEDADLVRTIQYYTFIQYDTCLKFRVCYLT